MRDNFGWKARETAGSGERNETDPRRWARGYSNRDRHSATLIIGSAQTVQGILLQLGTTLRIIAGR